MTFTIAFLAVTKKRERFDKITVLLIYKFNGGSQIDLFSISESFIEIQIVREMMWKVLFSLCVTRTINTGTISVINKFKQRELEAQRQIGYL